MNEVQERLRWAVEGEAPRHDGLDQVHRAVRRASVRNRILAGLVGGLVAVGAGVVVVHSFEGVEQQRQKPNPTANAAGHVDVAALTRAWTATVPGGSYLFGPQQDGSRIFVPTMKGVVAYPKDCRAPCRPLWTLAFGGKEDARSAEIAIGDGVVVATLDGEVAAVASDCRSDGGPCRPMWRAEPPSGSSRYLAPLVDGRVVRVELSTGEMPNHHVSAVAFPLTCREDGELCSPLWTADLGVGTASIPGTALNGVFYQQVGTVMWGFRSDCGSEGGTCQPDFKVDVVPGRPGAVGSLIGPVGRNGEVVFSGNAVVYAFPEHCAPSCSPLWIGYPGEGGGSQPKLAGNQVVVAGGSGLSAFALGCGTGGATCHPTWIAPVNRYASVEFADDHIVVAAQHQGRGRLMAFPVDCRARCAKLWASEPGEIYGVASDGKTVFAVFEDDELRAYPIDCADPCDPVWSAEVRGAVWWILLDSDHAIAAGRDRGPRESVTRLTVFTDRPGSQPASG